MTNVTISLPRPAAQQLYALLNNGMAAAPKTAQKRALLSLMEAVEAGLDAPPNEHEAWWVWANAG